MSNEKKQPDKNFPIVGTDKTTFIAQRGGEPKHIGAVLRQIAITLMSNTSPTDISATPRKN